MAETEIISQLESLFSSLQECGARSQAPESRAIALDQLTTFEMMAAGDDSTFIRIESLGWNADTLYTIYMIIILLSNDTNGAKYLWRRAPDMVKNADTCRFCSIWEAGKCLWQEDVVGAYKALDNDKMSNFQNTAADKLAADLVKQFKTSLQKRQTLTISLSYSVATLDFLSEALFCPTRELTLQYIAQFNWSHDASTDSVNITPLSTDTMAQQQIERENVKSNMALLNQASKYVAFFEKKSLSAEKGKSESEETATPQKGPPSSI